MTKCFLIWMMFCPTPGMDALYVDEEYNQAVLEAEINGWTRHSRGYDENGEMCQILYKCKPAAGEKEKGA